MKKRWKLNVAADTTLVVEQWEGREEAPHLMIYRYGWQISFTIHIQLIVITRANISDHNSPGNSQLLVGLKLCAWFYGSTALALP
jgi:hypothetical protein